MKNENSTLLVAGAIVLAVVVSYQLGKANATPPAESLPQRIAKHPLTNTILSAALTTAGSALVR